MTRGRRPPLPTSPSSAAARSRTQPLPHPTRPRCGADATDDARLPHAAERRAELLAAPKATRAVCSARASRQQQPDAGTAALPRRIIQIVDPWFAGLIAKQFRRLREEVEQADGIQRDRTERLAELITRQAEGADRPSEAETAQILTGVEVGQGRVQSAVQRVTRGMMRAFDLHLWNRLEPSQHAATVVSLYREHAASLTEPLSLDPTFYRDLSARRRAGTLGAMETTLDPILAMFEMADQLARDDAPEVTRLLAAAQVARGESDRAPLLVSAAQATKHPRGPQAAAASLKEWNDTKTRSRSEGLRDRQRDLQNRTQEARSDGNPIQPPPPSTSAARSAARPGHTRRNSRPKISTRRPSSASVATKTRFRKAERLQKLTRLKVRYQREGKQEQVAYIEEGLAHLERSGILRDVASIRENIEATALTEAMRKQSEVVNDLERLLNILLARKSIEALDDQIEKVEKQAQTAHSLSSVNGAPSVAAMSELPAEQELRRLAEMRDREQQEADRKRAARAHADRSWRARSSASSDSSTPSSGWRQASRMRQWPDSLAQRQAFDLGDLSDACASFNARSRTSKSSRRSATPARASTRRTGDQQAMQRARDALQRLLEDAPMKPGTVAATLGAMRRVRGSSRPTLPEPDTGRSRGAPGGRRARRRVAGRRGAQADAANQEQSGSSGGRARSLSRCRPRLQRSSRRTPTRARAGRRERPAARRRRTRAAAASRRRGRRGRAGLSDAQKALAGRDAGRQPSRRSASALDKAVMQRKENRPARSAGQMARSPRRRSWRTRRA